MKAAGFIEQFSQTYKGVLIPPLLSHLHFCSQLCFGANNPKDPYLDSGFNK